jgi:hypothetical protein
MTEFEVFRITPEVNEKCYEYAESTRSQGRWPNERRFTNVKPQYVGRLIKIETGGYGDNGWRRDYFQDNTGKERVVNYSYEGNTCFREVPCLPAVVPSLESLSRNVVKKNMDYSSLPQDDPQRMIIEGANGGKNRRHKRSKKNKRSRRSKKTKRTRSKR